MVKPKSATAAVYLAQTTVAIVPCLHYIKEPQPATCLTSMILSPVTEGGWREGEILHNITYPYSLSRKHDDALKIAHSGSPVAMPIASIDVPVMWHRSGMPSQSSVTS